MDGAAGDLPAGDAAGLGAVPVGFTVSSLAVLLVVARSTRAAGRDPGPAVREMAWGLRPALPASLISDAVEHVLARS